MMTTTSGEKVKYRHCEDVLKKKTERPHKESSWQRCKSRANTNFKCWHVKYFSSSQLKNAKLLKSQ